MRTSVIPVLRDCALAVCFLGCVGGGEIETHSNDVNATTDVDEFLSKIPKLDVPDAQDKTKIDCGDVCPNDEQDGDYFCSYTRYTETAQFEEFVAFQPNPATLWPGVVVQGDDAEQGLLTPIGVELAPVTFSVSLQNLSSRPVCSMEKPSLSAFRDARNATLRALAFSSSVAGFMPRIFCWFGQMRTHTLKSMMVPSHAPTPIG